MIHFLQKLCSLPQYWWSSTTMQFKARTLVGAIILGIWCSLVAVYISGEQDIEVKSTVTHKTYHSGKYGDMYFYVHFKLVNEDNKTFNHRISYYESTWKTIQVGHKSSMFVPRHRFYSNWLFGSSLVSFVILICILIALAGLVIVKLVYWLFNIKNDDGW